jgi:hypothetical protein
MQQPNRFYLFMKNIWPYINKAITAIIFFIVAAIKGTFREFMRAIKGQSGY